MSLFLTQGLLSYETAAHRHLSDSYRWHQATWQCFQGKAQLKDRFLYRVDQQDKQIRLLLLAATPAAQPEWWDGNWATKKLPSDFLSHQSYNFELRANPTRMSKTGNRQAIIESPELEAWMARKAAQGGFVIQSLLIDVEGPKFFTAKGRSGLHHSVNFKGSFLVENPQLFSATFAQGIGSAKAFGFGLLLPLPETNPTPTKQETPTL